MVISLVKFVNIFFRHNIRFNELTSLPENISAKFKNDAERVGTLIEGQGLRVGEVFGYFR